MRVLVELELLPSNVPPAARLKRAFKRLLWDRIKVCRAEQVDGQISQAKADKTKDCPR